MIMSGQDGQCEVRARLGTWLFNAIMETTGWFEKKLSWSGKKSTT
jgi:hypothetical protein